ncbi:hypothetical protein Q3G72_013024 [Acer saccharum]|nr:hypothetical protein Q3G72_013024 [Acer saccharum]
MKIGDILKQELILPELQAMHKADVLHEMVVHLQLHSGPFVQNTAYVLDALLTRERLGSTGVGEGVAIPHAKIAGLKDLMACFARKQQGISYDAIDEQPVKLVFMLLVPENSAGVHLKALARISRLLKNAEFRARLLQMPDAQAVYGAFIDEDGKHQQHYV